MTADWDAQTYHEISEPQFRWGLEVLSELDLRGDETVLDAGCGSGRLTAALAERLPNGHVIALDSSQGMLEVAKETLAPFGSRVSFVRADLGALTLAAAADVVFSTATFHWVTDHSALFRGLYRALKPTGRLHAQCGGAGNLRRHLELALQVARQSPWGLEDVTYPTYFADPEGSVRRLTEARFADARAWLKAAPTPFPDAQSFRRFIAHVTLRTVVAALGPKADAWLDTVTERSAPAYTLDYVRLELRASKPR
jgi:trans-aconitate 2-methyltransferase